MGKKNHDWPILKGSSIRVAVYVPDTKNVSTRIKHEEHVARAREIEKFMRKKFGGTTTIKGMGTWKFKDCPKGVCIDNHLIVESFTNQKKWNKYDEQLIKYIKKKKGEWSQSSVSVEWEDLAKELPYEGLHFV
jgi:hypothetical protein